ncbi:BREX-1 system phosphatase PglZ type A [Bacillus sp. ISL-47]|uniref:BREX-1 system phosphatase PglZ type A n=1 Tax=Bacillus sp. ISL-47 TaxID=2819130 RepID=UPI001BE876D2|nr:BREX-1 system phosphatase PglZ type A [Bacillus sp. ISL-47]MBT2687283.1 BREX-1 system phosphatase PglZ type A [Bacillus sp. ISL-47]MBT2706647.1 BREX-1 system phosphatase PglZ type A [Pseudomonas sp. ISL-84]
MDVIELVRERIRDEKNNKERAVVFWYDSAGQETVESLTESLANEDVTVLEITANNFFNLKIEIEIVHPKRSYLLYAPFSRPADEENFLLDILFYGSEFKADQIAIWSEQLGVEDVILRTVANRYSAFFNSKERRGKLNKVVNPSPKEEEVETAVLAVLTSSPSSHISYIAKNLLLDGLEEDQNSTYKKISKLFSINRMWELLEQYFGLHLSDEQRTLRHLMEQLLYSHFSRDAVVSIKSLDEKYSTIRANICALFIDDWMRGKAEEVVVLEGYIRNIGSNFHLRNHFLETSIDRFDKTTTFPLVDIILIEKVIEELQHKTINFEAWKERISYRLNTHWGRKSKIAGLYRTLLEAVRLTEYKEFLTRYDTREELYGQYAARLHTIDHAYRHFMQAYTRLEQRDYVESIAEVLTNWYENVYLRKIGDETNYILANEQSSKIPLQNRFFKRTIQPILDKESTRVFVIISDALRYEVGFELCDHLNKRVNGEASISPMLASLPTYTQLGMASLLPHRKLTIGENKIVYADGEPTNGTVNRSKILQKVNPDAVAYRWEEFENWTQTEADSKFKGKRLVYLYHDVIDAIGDSKKSERDTYVAAEKAIKDLERTIDRLSRLQAKRIFITSDHGFLFQYPKIEADVKIEAVNGNIIEGNRRFALGQGLTIPEGAVKLNDKQSELSEVEAVIAKGINRFTGGGGLQFIHGGAMPQERIIPLIEYRRTDRAELVGVSVAMLDKVITNFRVPVTFYQEESISSDYLPRKIKAAFYIDNERISNEIEYTFNLTGDNPQRTEKLIFNLAETYYTLGQPCTLKIETVQDKSIEFYKEETFTIRMYEALY